jgi:pimeloyl-ACP methyl ester carboxylesterase
VVQLETQYAKCGPVSIAYQVVGDGPTDLILVPGFVSHVEVAWEEPRLARFLSRLASFSRLIMFDKRGTGMSDPVISPHQWTSGWMTSEMENSNRPETAEFAAFLAGISDDPLKCRNLDVLREENR